MASPRGSANLSFQLTFSAHSTRVAEKRGLLASQAKPIRKLKNWRTVANQAYQYIKSLIHSTKCEKEHQGNDDLENSA